MYEVVLLDKAVKQLSKLSKKEAAKVAAKIDKLQNDPYPPGSKKLQVYDKVYRDQARGLSDTL